MRKPLAVLLALAFWAGYLAILFAAAKVKLIVPGPWQPLAWGVASCVGLLGLTLGFLKAGGRPSGDAGVGVDGRTAGRVAAGLLVGGAVYFLDVLAVAAVAGPIHLARAPGPGAGSLALAAAGTFALAAMEELGFRGYPLRTLTAAVGLWPAQALVAAAFGACHLLFGWSWPSVLLGVVPAALLLGFAATASRGLALPLGIHAGLNLARSAVEQNGVWTLAIDDPGRAASVAPVTGVAITLLAAAVFWVAGGRGEGVKR